MTKKQERLRELEAEIRRDYKIVGGRVHVPCRNCGGTGNYPSSMIPAGRCRFYCWRAEVPHHDEVGTVESYARKLYDRELRAERRHRRAQERREAAELRAQDLPDVLQSAMKAWHKVEGRGKSIVEDIRVRYVTGADLTEAQCVLLEDLTRQAEERVKELEGRKPAPRGRVEVTGTVLKVETRDYSVGYTVSRRDVMTVKSDDGWLGWGTVPAKVGGGVFPGRRIRFTATIEPKDGDPFFAFFKRPSKAALLGRATS